MTLFALHRADRPATQGMLGFGKETLVPLSMRKATMSEMSVSTSMMPVRDETLTLNGLRFHYRDWGSPEARPLVLLHGGLGNARHWDPGAIVGGSVPRARARSAGAW